MDSKLDFLLDVSVALENGERTRFPDLEAGFDAYDDSWEVVIKATEEFEGRQSEYVDMTFEKLLSGYWIAKGNINDIKRLAYEPAVIFIEKPKAMYVELNLGLAASCVYRAREEYSLSGKGVLVGIIDSGIDISNSAYLDNEGKTRIKAIWDQSKNAVYSQEDIDAILADNLSNNAEELPGRDYTGHGEAISQIAAGKYGVATGADIVVVKLGAQRGQEFVRTTQIIRGVDFLIRYAIKNNQPIAINISYGSNYGDHQGDSILERFIDECSDLYKCVICVGAGNEGRGRTHFNGIASKTRKNIELSVGDNEVGISVEMWQNPVDDFEITVSSPDGSEIAIANQEQTLMRLELSDIWLIVYKSGSTPYNIMSCTYMALIPKGRYIDAGIWKINVMGKNIVNGEFDMWLPMDNTLNRTTGFLEPSVEGTITVPATARSVISVGAYDARTGAVATFSGRGNVYSRNIKPDLVAPGVGIVMGNREVTGTSFATPFVTGCAALMMQWGIVLGNDNEMFGEKVKAGLIRGALREGMLYPNISEGWGKLCVNRSIGK